jgi:hypothetical protein
VERTPKDLDLERLHTNFLYLGLVLDFFVPAVLLSLGLFLRSQGVGARAIEGLDLLLWIFLTVSAGEILAIYLVKKKILFAQNMPKTKEQGIFPKQILLRSALILFSLSLSPAIYGFVYFLLGGTLERFVLFIAITLFCFVLFKPKLEEMKSLKNGLSRNWDSH